MHVAVKIDGQRYGKEQGITEICYTGWRAQNDMLKQARLPINDDGGCREETKT